MRKNAKQLFSKKLQEKIWFWTGSRLSITRSVSAWRPKVTKAYFPDPFHCVELSHVDSWWKISEAGNILARSSEMGCHSIGDKKHFNVSVFRFFLSICIWPINDRPNLNPRFYIMYIFLSTKNAGNYNRKSLILQLEVFMVFVKYRSELMQKNGKKGSFEVRIFKKLNICPTMTTIYLYWVHFWRYFGAVAPMFMLQTRVLRIFIYLQCQIVRIPIQSGPRQENGIVSD